MPRLVAERVREVRWAERPIYRYNVAVTPMTVLFAGLADVYPHAAIVRAAGTLTRVGAPKVGLR